MQKLLAKNVGKRIITHNMMSGSKGPKFRCQATLAIPHVWAGPKVKISFVQAQLNFGPLDPGIMSYD